MTIKMSQRYTKYTVYARILHGHLLLARMNNLDNNQLCERKHHNRADSRNLWSCSPSLGKAEFSHWLLCSFVNVVNLQTLFISFVESEFTKQVYDFVTYKEWMKIVKDIQTKTTDQSIKDKLQEYLDDMDSLSYDLKQERRDIANGAIIFLLSADATKVSFWIHQNTSTEHDSKYAITIWHFVCKRFFFTLRNYDGHLGAQMKHSKVAFLDWYCK